METLRCNVFVPLPLNIVWNYWPQVLLDNVAHQSFPKKLVKGQGPHTKLFPVTILCRTGKSNYWGLVLLTIGTFVFKRWQYSFKIGMAGAREFFLTSFLLRTPNHSRRIQQLQLLSSATQTWFLFLLAHGNPMKKLGFSLTWTDHPGRNVFPIFSDAAIIISKTHP